MLQLVKKGFLDRGLGLEPPEKVKVTGKEENKKIRTRQNTVRAEGLRRYRPA